MVISCNPFGVATSPNAKLQICPLLSMKWILHVVLPSIIIWHSVRWISGALNEHCVKFWALNRAIMRDAQSTKSNFTSTKLSALPANNSNSGVARWLHLLSVSVQLVVTQACGIKLAFAMCLLQCLHCTDEAHTCWNRGSPVCSNNYVYTVGCESLYYGILHGFKKKLHKVWQYSIFIISFVP